MPPTGVMRRTVCLNVTDEKHACPAHVRHRKSPIFRTSAYVQIFHFCHEPSNSPQRKFISSGNDPNFSTPQLPADPKCKTLHAFQYRHTPCTFEYRLVQT